MKTPLTDVYDFFLSKVSDYNFLKLNEEGLLEEHLFRILRSSAVRFTNCNNDLTIDKDKDRFQSELTDMELEILSSLMALNYTSGKILHVNNMEQIMTDKEYSTYSQANHLSQLLTLRDKLQSDVSHLMSIYSLSEELGEMT